MPVKPVLNPPQWAVPGNYTTGPFIGLTRRIAIAPGVANEGHRPGAGFPTTAEEWNDWLAMVGELARWVFAGTQAPIADTRIVETNIDGRLLAQYAEFEPSANPGVPAVRGISNGLAAFDAAASSPIEIGYQFDDVGVGAFLRSSGATTMFILNVGAGPGISGAAVSNYGVDFQSNATNAGIHGEGFLATPGVHGHSANTATGVGVVGEATNPGAVGIRGQTDATADGFGKGVHGLGLADGVGVVAESDDGYALTCESGGNLPPFRILGTFSNPVTPGTDGSIWYNNFRNRYGYRRNAKTMFGWESVGGSVSAADRTDGALVFNAPIEAAQAKTLDDHSPSVAFSQVWIQVSFRWETAGAAIDIEVELTDDTNANTVLAVTWANNGVPNGPQPTCVLSDYYVIPTAGETQFTLRLTPAVLGTLIVVQPCITVIGAF